MKKNTFKKKCIASIIAGLFLPTMVMAQSMVPDLPDDTKEPQQVKITPPKQDNIKGPITVYRPDNTNTSPTDGISRPVPVQAKTPDTLPGAKGNLKPTPKPKLKQELPKQEQIKEEFPSTEIIEKKAPLPPKPVSKKEPEITKPELSPEIVASVDEITRINSEITLLNAQKKALELRAEIAAKKAELSSDSVVLGGSKTATSPVVKSIEGVNGKLMATIQIGATEQMVKQGEKINGWTVSKITGTSVTLRQGKQTRNLAFGQELTTIWDNSGNNWSPADQSASFNQPTLSQ